MKKVLLGSVALVALSVGAANADDRFVSWAGLYVGLNAGYTWSNSVRTTGTPTFANSAFPLGSTDIANALAGVGTNTLPRTHGFIGGGQIGYNYQYSNYLVAGIEADFQGLAGGRRSASLTKTTTLVNFPAENYVSTVSVRRLDYLGTVRGRAGILLTETFLAYGTGGLAYGGASNGLSINAVESLGNPPYLPVSGNTSAMRFGWTVGAGLEWLWAANWSAKVEYLYYDLGRPRFTLTQNCVPGSCGDPAAGPWGAAEVRSRPFAGHIVRVGVNYRFSWGSLLGN